MSDAGQASLAKKICLGSAGLKQVLFFCGNMSKDSLFCLHGAFCI